ncbi:MFS transporter [Phytohabitans sp. LJ34]|uniref:MFS transporter n=1 Tax=Phytohabitans sp. LJ34 TaxID=3452217 RepID=UPI003F895005
MRQRLAFAALLLGPFVGVLDVLIVTVAVPAIRADLDATFGQAQLVVAGYATAYGVGLITGARLGDRYGRRRLFLTGLLLFVAASAGCAAAPDANLLIAARILQGLAAAAFVPQVLSIVRAWLPDQARPSAVGWYGTVVGVGAVSGPVIGGLLMGWDVAELGWRLVFLVNVPLGLLAIAGVLRGVPESRSATAARLDLAGAVTSTIGLAALLVSLTQGGEHGWSPQLLALLATGVLMLGGFVVRENHLERRGGAPLLPPRLFKHRNFTWALIAVALLYATDASFFVLSFHLLDGLHLTPTWVGILLMPVGAGFAIGSRAAPRLFARLGLPLIAGGIALQAMGYAAIALHSLAAGPTAQPPLLAVALLAVGIGHGLAVNPLFDLVISSTTDADAGAAVRNAAHHHTASQRPGDRHDRFCLPVPARPPATRAAQPRLRRSSGVDNGDPRRGKHTRDSAAQIHAPVSSPDNAGRDATASTRRTHVERTTCRRCPVVARHARVSCHAPRPRPEPASNGRSRRRMRQHARARRPGVTRNHL